MPFWRTRQPRPATTLTMTNVVAAMRARELLAPCMYSGLVELCIYDHGEEGRRTMSDPGGGENSEEGREKEEEV